MRAGLLAIGLLALCEVAYAAPEDSAYTLYRTSVFSDIKRVHVATFDTTEVEAYNQENCMIAADLFKQQSGVKVRYWCERGRFKQ